METLFFSVLRSSCLACTRPCNPDRIPTETTWGLVVVVGVREDDVPLVDKKQRGIQERARTR